MQLYNKKIQTQAKFLHVSSKAHQSEQPEVLVFTQIILRTYKAVLKSLIYEKYG